MKDPSAVVKRIHPVAFVAGRFAPRLNVLMRSNVDLSGLNSP